MHRPLILALLLSFVFAPAALAAWDFEYTADGGVIADNAVQWFPLFVPADETGVVYLELEIAALTHGSPMDLDIYLLDPAGGGIEIMEDRGDQVPITDVTLVFSDDAASLPPANTELLPGTYLPEGPGNFSQYYPVVGAGQWTLVVADDAVGSSGGFESFTLRGIPEPATLSLLVLGGLVTLRRKRS